MSWTCAPSTTARRSTASSRVETTDDTTCEVDGDELDVTDCLAALADLPDDTLTVAHGAL